MHELMSPQTLRRAVLAACPLAVMAFTMTVGAPVTSAAPAGNCTYYSDASHATVVGEFGKDCCNNVVARGYRTSYYVCGGCFICYPPPR
jgi:hypothetical protein